jgi:hypothetical protein
MVGTVMMVILGLAVAWALGSIVLRALAWIFMGAALISTVASIPVPGAAAATALVCWLLGHGLFRLKYGFWRSQLLGAVLP